MIEKLVLATAITFVLSIFIGISSSSAESQSQARSVSTPLQVANLIRVSVLQEISQ